MQNDSKFYLIGGGIASLSAAAFLIRDADIPGRSIVILEQLDRLGGSLDGAGSAEDGYVVRGGRMIESKYLCTYDLFSSIPTLDGAKTVTQEIFEWNQVMQTSSKCRLVRGGRGIDAPEYGLSDGDRRIFAAFVAAFVVPGHTGTSKSTTTSYPATVPASTLDGNPAVVPVNVPAETSSSGTG